MSGRRVRFLIRMPWVPKAIDAGCWRRCPKKEAVRSGLELRPPEKQLRSYVVGERDAK